MNSQGFFEDKVRMNDGDDRINEFAKGIDVISIKYADVWEGDWNGKFGF